MRDTSLLGSMVPKMCCEGAGIDTLDADDVLRGQILLEGLATSPIAGGPTGFLHDEAGQPRLSRFHIFGVDAVVSDVRIRHCHHLPTIRGIGHNLLITGHRGVENHFPRRFAGSAEGSALKDGSIGEGENRRLHLLHLRTFTHIRAMPRPRFRT